MALQTAVILHGSFIGRSFDSVHTAFEKHAGGDMGNNGRAWVTCMTNEIGSAEQHFDLANERKQAAALEIVLNV
ncbi:unnamed protein product [Linum trigynum]|uniref:Uncharacterized protein n=1 Tax=Linum trigynum TaxID=586398 RepID=A0AAV2F9Y9_9ROSI